jgi:thiol:disulfide interchange protein DsbD
MSNRGWLPACLAVWLVSGPALAQSPVPRKVTAPHVTVELIAAAATLPPAGGAWLGLRLILEPGWHVYWQNPGDSGGPPTVVWTPSAGLAPGAFEWPAPERIPYGKLVNYGYHGDVVLPFKVDTKAAGSSGTLDARVNWLVCKEVCVSGKGRLAIGFPLAADAAAAVPAWRQMIDEARGRVPRPAPAGWRVEGRDEGPAWSVTVTTGRRESGGTFFPLEAGIVEDAAPQQPSPFDRGLRFTLEKSDLLTSTPTTLRGVVALDSGATHVVSVPLDRPAPSRGRIP